MKLEIEIPYPVTGVLPHHRKQTSGVATFQKQYDLFELPDDVTPPAAFTFAALGSTLSKRQNREGHDIYSTFVLDDHPWMAIGDGASEAGSLSLSDQLGHAVSRRIERSVKLEQNGFGFDTLNPAEFRSIQEDGRLQCETLADDVVSRMMLWRGRLFERDIVPMYAVHGGDRPDISVAPSSSARYNFFDHFLPDDREGAVDRFSEYGGRSNAKLPTILPAAEFSYDLAIHRALIGRTAKELVDCLDDGIYRDSIARWRLRLGGMKFLRSAELIEARFDDDTLELAELGQALTAALSVASELRPAPDDPLSKATAFARHRLSALLDALAKNAGQELPSPR